MTRGLVSAVGALALASAAAAADTREGVPLPAIPEHMAVPTPTEGVEILPTPEFTVVPSPTAKPRPHKHRKNPTPKPAEGIEKL